MNTFKLKKKPKKFKIKYTWFHIQNFDPNNYSLNDCCIFCKTKEARITEEEQKQQKIISLAKHYNEQTRPSSLNISYRILAFSNVFKSMYLSRVFKVLVSTRRRRAGKEAD
jgi:hypothetical protein